VLIKIKLVKDSFAKLAETNGVHKFPKRVKARFVNVYGIGEAILTICHVDIYDNQLSYFNN